MAYLASDLFSGTWKNIVGITASWQSNQNNAMRGFTAFVDGYGNENNGASIVYEGSNYYEWGYVFKDTDLDGALEINAELADIFTNRTDLTYVAQGYDEVIGRYFSSTHSEDRPSDSGTWDRNPQSYDGTFSGSDLGIFEIDIELDFTSTENNDLIMGTTNNDLISGNGGDDYLMSRSGNDTLEGGLGNDSINGGYGTDTAIFKYNYSNYKIEEYKSFEISNNYFSLLNDTESSNSLTFKITSDNEGIDSLTGVELVKFADKTIGIDYSNPIKEYNYLLQNIKDYDGNLHANTGNVSDSIKTSYKYQGKVDVNNDGVLDAIFTNKFSGRWAAAEADSITGQIDFDDHGAGGGTRIVGIYDDPLIAVGNANGGFLHDGVTPAPAQFGATGSDRYLVVNGETIDRLALNSQVRFQNDLYNDNLTVKTSGDYDGDGFQEVYWKTNDGDVYLRSLMHADGNIQYANYQNQTQMSDYLTGHGYQSVISDII